MNFLLPRPSSIMSETGRQMSLGHSHHVMCHIDSGQVTGRLVRANTL
ncbi:MAG: hypothetical protein ACYC21_10290 [Eubacteriales bacterium]